MEQEEPRVVINSNADISQMADAMRPGEADERLRSRLREIQTTQKQYRVEEEGGGWTYAVNIRDKADYEMFATKFLSEVPDMS